MAGEDRQRVARDAHERMLDFESDARHLKELGRVKQAGEMRRQASMARRQRDRYDDAGVFKA